MTLQVERLDTLLKNADPLISETLNRALSDKEISEKEAVRLYEARGIDFHLVGMVANELRNYFETKYYKESKGFHENEYTDQVVISIMLKHVF